MNRPRVEPGAEHVAQPFGFDPRVLHIEPVVVPGQVRQVVVARMVRGDVEPAPLAPLARNLVLLHESAQVVDAGGAQRRVAALDLQALDGAVGIVVQHESGIAPGCPVPDARRVDQRDSVLVPQLRQAPGNRQAARPGADDGPVTGEPPVHGAGLGRRFRQDLVPPVRFRPLRQRACLPASRTEQHRSFPRRRTSEPAACARRRA